MAGTAYDTGDAIEGREWYEVTLDILNALAGTTQETARQEPIPTAPPPQPIGLIPGVSNTVLLVAGAVLALVLLK